VSENGIETALIYPPIADITQMYPAIPSLAAFLCHNKKTVKQFDLNIDFYTNILSPKSIKNAFNELLEHENSHNSDCTHAPQQIIEVAKILYGDTISNIAAAIREIKNTSTYENIKTYRWCANVIENALFIVSAPFYPTRIGIFSYGMRYSVDSSDDVRAAILDARENPFVGYFHDAIENGTLKDVRDFNLIGISVTYQNQLIPALTLAKEIRRKHPACKLVIGGQFLTQSVNPLIKSSILQEHFDYVITHEGETALLRLIQFLERAGNESDIPNFINLDSVSSNEACEDATTLCHVHTEDLDALPTPDYSQFPHREYLSPLVLLLAPTRGCYWNKCSFCDISPSMKKMYRERSVENVVNDIARLKESYSTNCFNFSVDAITPKYLKKLSQALIDNEMDIVWGAELRMEKSFAKENLAELLYNAGLRYVFFGFESASQRIMDLVKKGTSVDTSETLVHVFSRYGIKIYLAWIVGLPGETEDDFWKTVDFIDRNKAHIHSSGATEFYLSINTDIGLHPQKYGIAILDKNLDLSVSRDYLPSKGFTQHDAKNFTKVARLFLEDTFTLFTTGGLNAHSFLSSLVMPSSLRGDHFDVQSSSTYKPIDTLLVIQSNALKEKWFLFDTITQKLLLANKRNVEIIKNTPNELTDKDFAFYRMLFNNNLLTKQPSGRHQFPDSKASG
jgi:radical SAM superfamily enzyme YgiQ (UPF0313 family)